MMTMMCVCVFEEECLLSVCRYAVGTPTLRPSPSPGVNSIVPATPSELLMSALRPPRTTILPHPRSN